MTSHNPRILDSAVKRGYERVSLEEIYRRCNWPMDSEEEKKKLEWLKAAGMEAVIKSKDIARVSAVDDWIGRFRKKIGF